MIKASSTEIECIDHLTSKWRLFKLEQAGRAAVAFEDAPCCLAHWCADRSLKGATWAVSSSPASSSPSERMLKSRDGFLTAGSPLG